jgi:hypothetical protein
VEPAIGKGQNHIVAVGLDVGTVETIEIRDNIFVVDGTSCVREEESKYSSQLPPDHLKISKLRKNMPITEQCYDVPVKCEGKFVAITY